MSLQNRRSSLANIDDWLDKCSNDEPDSMIYEADYCNEVAAMRSELRKPDLESLYRIVADMCTKIGLTPQLVDERLNDIDDCITTYITTIQNDVQLEYDRLCHYKDDLLKQVQKMMKDLYLPEDESLNDTNITLLQHCKRLKTKFNELNVIKQKRMTRLEELRDKQGKLCLILGIERPPLKLKTDIPTEQELTTLATAILDMEKEEARRKAKYLKLKQDIKMLIEQLELDKSQFGGDDFELPNYTESYLIKMTNIYTELETLHSEAQEKFKNLKEKLLSLYERLDTPQEERDLFLTNHLNCSPTTMLEMEIEIEHLEKLKKQNIGKFVEKIKDELMLEYEKCFFAQEEQDNFFSLFTVSGEDYSEELLELCERELDRVKKFYLDNKEILDKFQKWRMMWKELIEIELKANDPNRFTNRGGQLLLEEKKRKTLQKGLPKIEKELSTLNQENYSKNFKVFGSNLEEFISGCWDELSNAKEEEKKERQRNKLKNPIVTNKAQPIIKKTPSKRPAGPGITPTPSKLKCQTPVPSSNGTIRSQNQLGFSGSVKKSAQKGAGIGNHGSQFSSNIPKPRLAPINNNCNNNNNNNGLINQREKRTIQSNSNGSLSLNSALSMSEQEFEDLIITCPASAKKGR